jgi:hypothetical protein
MTKAHYRFSLLSSLLAIAVFLPSDVSGAEIREMPFKVDNYPSKESCAIAVDFSGIVDADDASTGVFKAVKGYIESNTDLTGVFMYHYGMEGETSFCITSVPKDKRAEIGGQIKRLVSPSKSTRVRSNLN